MKNVIVLVIVLFLWATPAMSGQGMGPGPGLTTVCDSACQAAAAAAACAASMTLPVISATTYSYQRIDIALVSGGVGATSFVLKWGLSTGDRPNSISITLPYSHTGLTENTDYYYSVIGTNATCSRESAEVTTYTDP
jgi:hypothetical protein